MPSRPSAMTIMLARGLVVRTRGGCDAAPARTAIRYAARDGGSARSEVVSSVSKTGTRVHAVALMRNISRRKKRRRSARSVEARASLPSSSGPAQARSARRSVPACGSADRRNTGCARKCRACRATPDCCRVQEPATPDCGTAFPENARKRARRAQIGVRDSTPASSGAH